MKNIIENIKVLTLTFINSSVNLVVACKLDEKSSERAIKNKIAEIGLKEIFGLDAKAKENKEHLKVMRKKITEDYLGMLNNYIEFQEPRVIWIDSIDKKVKKTVTVNVKMLDRSKGKEIIEPKEMEVYKTKVEEYKNFKLFIRKDVNNDYVVTEASTGMSIAESYTKKGLEEKLERIVESAEKIKKQIANQKNLNPNIVNTEEYKKELGIGMVTKQIKELSSGTLGVLFKTKEYKKLDRCLEEWLEFAEGRNEKTWKESYKQFLECSEYRKLQKELEGAYDKTVNTKFKDKKYIIHYSPNEKNVVDGKIIRIDIINGIGLDAVEELKGFELEVDHKFNMGGYSNYYVIPRVKEIKTLGALKKYILKNNTVVIDPKDYDGESMLECLDKHCENVVEKFAKNHLNLTEKMIREYGFLYYIHLMDDIDEDYTEIQYYIVMDYLEFYLLVEKSPTIKSFVTKAIK